MSNGRQMVNLPAELARRVKQRARDEKRSVSNLLGCLVAEAFEPTETTKLAAELTRLGVSPEMALRNALAEVERDTALSRGVFRVEAA